MNARRWTALLVCGLLLTMAGAGMRAVAQWDQQRVLDRLTARVPGSMTDTAVAFSRADGRPRQVRLPSFGLWNDLTTVDMVESPSGLAWDVADAGWHRASGAPGFRRNVVLAGHSPSQDLATWQHSVFRQLAYLTPGEQIELTAGGRVYAYSVTAVFAVPAALAHMPEYTRWTAPGHTERLTLITCFPPHTAAYRVVAIALPTEDVKE